MNRINQYLVSFAAAAGVILAPAEFASAQKLNYTEYGDFTVMPRIDPITDKDETIVFLRPQDEGQVTLAMDCRGSAFYMHLMSQVELDGESPLLVYRFDQDRPDTTIVLRTGDPSDRSRIFYLLPRQDQNRFASRMRTARRLVIRVRHRVSRTTLDLFYDLAQSTQALARARCSLAMTPLDSSDPDVLGRLALERALVEELPDVVESGGEVPEASSDWRAAERSPSTYVVVIEGVKTYYPLTCDIGRTLLNQAKEGLPNKFFSSREAAESAGYTRAPSC